MALSFSQGENKVRLKPALPASSLLQTCVCQRQLRPLSTPVKFPTGSCLEWPSHLSKPKGLAAQLRHLWKGVQSWGQPDQFGESPGQIILGRRHGSQTTRGQPQIAKGVILGDTSRGWTWSCRPRKGVLRPGCLPLLSSAQRSTRKLQHVPALAFSGMCQAGHSCRNGPALSLTA